MESGYKVYMKLRIRNVSKEDFMEYKCLAKNSLGGSDGSITLYGWYQELKFVSRAKFKCIIPVMNGWLRL